MQDCKIRVPFSVLRGMGRKPRVHFPRAVYHVVLRGNDRQAIFVDAADREVLSERLSEGVRRFGYLIHAFVFMTNHIHLAVEIARLPLAISVHNFAFRYARHFNRRHGRCGHLFERRHHAGLIDTEHQLKRLVRYIHLNPVRAGMVSDPSAYGWSSHAAYVRRGNAPSWLTVEPVLRLFSPIESTARARLAEFVHDGLPGDGDSAHAIEQGDPDEEDRLLADVWEREPLFEAPWRNPQQELRLDEVVASVCRIAGVRREELSSHSQRRELSRARGVIASVVRRSPNLTLHALGGHVCRDASSLSRAAEAVDRSARNGGAAWNLLRRVLDDLRLPPA